MIFLINSQRCYLNMYNRRNTSRTDPQDLLIYRLTVCVNVRKSRNDVASCCSQSALGQKGRNERWPRLPLMLPLGESLGA